MLYRMFGRLEVFSVASISDGLFRPCVGSEAKQDGNDE
jgi:hypothetical protein